MCLWQQFYTCHRNVFLSHEYFSGSWHLLFEFCDRLFLFYSDFLCVTGKFGSWYLSMTRNLFLWQEICIFSMWQLCTYFDRICCLNSYMYCLSLTLLVTGNIFFLEEIFKNTLTKISCEVWTFRAIWDARIRPGNSSRTFLEPEF